MTGPGLDDAFSDASLLGAELDTTYRVLGLTLEVGADVAARWKLPGDDRRLQVVLHPIGSFRASLLVQDPDDPRVEAFTVDQLVSVVSALDGPTCNADVLSPAMDDAVVRQVPASLEGTTSTVDGRSRRALVDVSAGDRRLLLTVTFDEAVVRDAAGTDLATG